MESHSVLKMPHLVFVTYPAPGQMNPMLQLAKLLHFNGFYITFVVTDSICSQRKKCFGSNTLEGLSCFRFERIPDGSSDDPEKRFKPLEPHPHMEEICVAAFSKLLESLNSSSDIPDVSCIISDLLMTFAKGVAQNFGIPLFMLWTTTAADLLACLHVPELIKRGYIPLKVENCLTNGYLDTSIDWIPGMKTICLRNLSSFIRTTDRDCKLIKEMLKQVNQALGASALILNTFDQLETDVLDAIKCFIPRFYTIGPLAEMLNRIDRDIGHSMSLSPWKEDTDSCKKWLDTQKEASVIYVSFGSLITLTSQQVIEFACGLIDSNHPFLWISRADLVKGGITALSPYFSKETEGKSFFANWCHQGEILSHPSVGGFLTHGGWNSTSESICAGVPMIFWPGFADQYTNCHYACQEWKIGLEIDQVVKREQVTELVKKLMEGDTKQEFKRNAMKWKNAAGEAGKEGGSSSANLKRLVKDLSA